MAKRERKKNEKNERLTLHAAVQDCVARFLVNGHDSVLSRVELVPNLWSESLAYLVLQAYWYFLDVLAMRHKLPRLPEVRTFRCSSDVSFTIKGGI